MTKIIALVLLLVASVLGVVFVATSPAESAVGCTKVGTNGENVLTGGRRNDVLCGLGGKDFLHADGGNDVLRGGSGPDTLVASTGADRAKGDGGRDRIFVVDGFDNDRVSGGAGFDRCYVDAGDSRIGCEKVYISFTAAQSKALTNAVFDVAQIAEDAQVSPTPAPTPPPGTAVTVTVTVTAPPPVNGGCVDPAPPQPDPFC